jgi:hypothetical protein
MEVTMQGRASDESILPTIEPLELSILAAGTTRMTMAELDAVRKESLRCLPRFLSPQLLKHSDEQTLASLVAVSEAIRSANMELGDFPDWAIVSSSKNLGRSDFAAVIDKYRQEGPWGVSVQVIPHCTAHAVAGTISLALDCHGPCIGVGREAEAFHSAACVLRRSDWFRVWIVLSSWSPEPSIDSTGRAKSDAFCLAAAIAVTREWTACSLGRIYWDTRTAPKDISAGSERRPLAPSFLEFLADRSAVRRKWSSPATDALRVHVELNGSFWDELKQRPAESIADVAGQRRAAPVMATTSR